MKTETRRHMVKLSEANVSAFWTHNSLVLRYNSLSVLLLWWNIGQNQLAGRFYFRLHVTFCHQRKLGQDLEVGTEAEPWKKNACWLAPVSLFCYPPVQGWHRPQCDRLSPRNYQSRKYSTDMITAGQSVGGYSSVGAPSSQLTLVGIKLKKLANQLMSNHSFYCEKL